MHEHVGDVKEGSTTHALIELIIFRYFIILVTRISNKVRSKFFKCSYQPFKHIFYYNSM